MTDEDDIVQPDSQGREHWPPQVVQTLRSLPSVPGVYQMKDDQGRIIYVGKAISLKNRVRSYFQQSKHTTPKVQVMVQHIAAIEIITTSSELEALILECNLIKKYRPKYNIRLKDDKNYPYIRINLQDDFPRLTIARSVRTDGSRYFGPYTSSFAVHETLHLLKKMFPLRTCNRKIGQDTGRPCLNFHIKRCLAPCDNRVDQTTYRAMINEVLLFLEGRQEKVIKMLHQRMEQAAENLDFEQAAQLRDQLQAIAKVAERQNIVLNVKDADVLGLSRSEFGACVQLLMVRDGKVSGGEHYLLQDSDGHRDAEVLTAFITQYYNRATFIAGEIWLSNAVEDEQLLSEMLNELAGRKVLLHVPQRGSRKQLVDLACENARQALDQEGQRLAVQDARVETALGELQHELQLSVPPTRIEAFDISNTQGTESVASMVVFEHGRPCKQAYRRFKIRTVEGPNDFASMQEVVKRRYQKAEPPLPDLILVDGGKGQLHSALEIIRGVGLTVPVIGLAKQEELIFTEYGEEPIFLPRHSQALYLVQRIRDEAHRFAITYHRKLRAKRNLTSVLDHISGVGPKRRQALWQHFGSLEKIKQADVEQLAAVPGLNKQVARQVYEFFRLRDTKKAP